MIHPPQLTNKKLKMSSSSCLFGLGFFGQVIYLVLSWLDGYTLMVFPGIFMLTLFTAFLGKVIWIPCVGVIAIIMMLKQRSTFLIFRSLIYVAILLGTGLLVLSANVKFHGMRYKIETHVNLDVLHALGIQQLTGDIEGPEFKSYITRYSREEIRVPVIVTDIWNYPPHDVFMYIDSKSQQNEILYIWKRIFGCDGIMIIPKGDEPRRVMDRIYKKISDGVYLVSQ